MNTTEHILAAARKRRKTLDIDLGDGIKVQVRELTVAERKALDDRLWVKGADGNPVVVDDEGKPVATGAGYFKPIDGVNIRREWLLATMTPVEAVDGMFGDDVPDSVRQEIFDAARTVNGHATSAAIVKN